MTPTKSKIIEKNPDLHNLTRELAGYPGVKLVVLAQLLGHINSLYERIEELESHIENTIKE